MLQMSQIEKPRCSAKIDQMRLRCAMDLPVDFQNVSSSGFQSAIQVEVRFLISLFLFGWRWRCWEGNSAAGGEQREKNAAARRSKRPSRAAALPVVSMPKLRRRQRWRRLALRFTSFVPSRKWLRKMSGNQ